MSNEDSPASGDGRRRRGLRQTSVNVVVGICVIVLYVGFVSVAFFGFSAYITRINLAQDLSEVEGGLDGLFFALTREEGLRDEVSAMTEEIRDTTRAVAEAEAKAQRMESESFSLNNAVRGKFYEASLLITRNRGIFSEKYVEDFRTALLDQVKPFHERQTRLKHLISAPIFSDAADPTEIEEMLADFRVISDELSEYDKRKLESDINTGVAYSEKELLESEVTEKSSQRSDLLTELKSVRSKSIMSYKALVASIRPMFWGLFYWLIQVPTIILTMVVTIASGGLGSVVSFTRSSLFNDADATLGELFISVGEGVAAAIAIFFLAGAGLLMLTNAGGEGTPGAEISPYMVAFLAFVSGFMAENAFKSIQRAGRNLFQERSTT